MKGTQQRAEYPPVPPWVGLGCGNGVGFVVKCIGIHIESSDSTTNPSHSTQNPTPKTHPCSTTALPRQPTTGVRSSRRCSASCSRTCAGQGSKVCAKFPDGMIFGEKKISTGLSGGAAGRPGAELVFFFGGAGSRLACQDFFSHGRAAQGPVEICFSRLAAQLGCSPIGNPL